MIMNTRCGKRVYGAEGDNKKGEGRGGRISDIIMEEIGWKRRRSTIMMIFWSSFTWEVWLGLGLGSERKVTNFQNNLK